MESKYGSFLLTYVDVKLQILTFIGWFWWLINDTVDRVGVHSVRKTGTQFKWWSTDDDCHAEEGASASLTKSAPTY